MADTAKLTIELQEGGNRQKPPSFNEIDGINRQILTAASEVFRQLHQMVQQTAALSRGMAPVQIPVTPPDPVKVEGQAEDVEVRGTSAPVEVSAIPPDQVQVPPLDISPLLKSLTDLENKLYALFSGLNVPPPAEPPPEKQPAEPPPEKQPPPDPANQNKPAPDEEPGGIDAYAIMDSLRPYRQQIKMIEQQWRGMANDMERQRFELAQQIESGKASQDDVIAAMAEFTRKEAEIVGIKRKQAELERQAAEAFNIQADPDAAMRKGQELAQIYRPHEQAIRDLVAQRESLLQQIGYGQMSDEQVRQALQRSLMLEAKIAQLKRDQAKQEQDAATEAAIRYNPEAAKRKGQELLQLYRPHEETIKALAEDQERVLQQIGRGEIAGQQVQQAMQEMLVRDGEIARLREEQAKQERKQAQIARQQVDPEYDQKQKMYATERAGFGVMKGMDKFGMGGLSNIIGGALEGQRFMIEMNKALEELQTAFAKPVPIPEPPPMPQVQPPGQPETQPAPPNPVGNVANRMPAQAPQQPAQAPRPPVAATRPPAPVPPAAAGGSAAGGAIAAAGPIGAAVGAALVAKDEIDKQIVSAIRGASEFGNAIAKIDADGFSKAINDNIVKNFPVVGTAAGAVGDAFMGLVNATEATAQRLSGYSPELALATALEEVRQTFRDIEAAQDLGVDLAAFVQQKGELDARVEQILLRLEKKLLPILIKVLTAVELILPAIERIGEGILVGVTTLIRLVSAVIPGANGIGVAVGILDSILEYLRGADADSMPFDNMLRGLLNPGDPAAPAAPQPGPINPPNPFNF